MPDHWAAYMLWTGLTPGSSAWGLMWLGIMMVWVAVPTLMVGFILTSMLSYSDWNRSVWEDGPHRWWWWTSSDPYRAGKVDA